MRVHVRNKVKKSCPVLSVPLFLPLPIFLAPVDSLSTHSKLSLHNSRTL